MTYCCAIRLRAGLVFLSDSRTNAGVDHISTFRKMTVFDHAGERLMVLLGSMDSTLRSNLSVGMPLDLLVYEANALRVTPFVTIDGSNDYYRMISTTWGRRLRQVFSEIPNPSWDPALAENTSVLSGGSPLRAPLPPEIAAVVPEPSHPATPPPPHPRVEPGSNLV